jgi:MFS family permease
LFKQAFRTLKYPNYRLFFGGQSISLIGTWMQQVAMSWLVYRLTGSALMLGVVGFVTRCPSFFFTPFTGVLIDRSDRYRVLLVTQALSLVQAAGLAALVLSGRVQVWHLFVAGTCLGLINAFDVPARQSFIIELIGKRDDLGNAIALNSTMMNGARLVGPVAAGVMVAAVGEGWCFAINAFSFVAVLASLLAMKLRPAHRASGLGSRRQAFREGLNHAFGSLPIRYLLLLLALVSLAGMPFQVLMPVFAKDVLRGGPSTQGLLVASVGVGALVATLYLASRKSVLGLARRVSLASILFGLALVAFSLSRQLWLSMAILAFVGLGMMVQMTGCNTLIQTLVDDDLRGRVMSFHTMAFMGTVPFGNLLAGLLAQWIGAPGAVLVGGLACVAAGAAFHARLPHFRRHARPIFIRKGILPVPVEAVP